MSDLPKVRRLEAVGFRAWPAATVQYDGSWLCRLTAGHPSRRLNSVNPLDPSDTRDIAIRLEKAGKRFADYGYEGWFVVEAEQDPKVSPPLEMAKKGHKELLRVMAAAGYEVVK